MYIFACIQVAFWLGLYFGFQMAKQDQERDK